MALVAERYTYDPSRDEWKQGKKAVEEENVLIFLIQFARTRKIQFAGDFGQAALSEVKQFPEISATGFTKECTVRDRNCRTAGKHLFAAWCRRVGIEIVGTLESFMVRNSLLVKRFYDSISGFCGQFRARARVAGQLFSSVVCGIRLKDETDENILDILADFEDVRPSFDGQKEQTVPRFRNRTKRKIRRWVT